MGETRNTTLDYSALLRTIEALEERIADRFPDAGLRAVCHDLIGTTKETQTFLEWLNKPVWWLRLITYGVVALGILLIIYSLQLVEYEVEATTFANAVALFESITNDLVLLGAALFFLFTVETRYKRSKAIAALNELRSLAHVVDMHQLTKDPTASADGINSTIHSPRRTYTAYELQRYLDYCSELLSLIGKVAALFPQAMPDDVVVHAVNDIENLCTGLARKVWQKLIVLNANSPDQGNSK